MTGTPRLALVACALLAAGCEVTPTRDSLSAIRRIGIVEPPEIEIVVQLGPDPAAPMFRPGATGRTPVYIPASTSRTAVAIGGAITGALDSQMAGHSAATTRRFQASCPDHAEKARALRAAIADAMRRSLAGRYETVIVPRDDVAALATGGASGAPEVDAFLVPNLLSAVWSGSPALDYRARTAGRLLLVARDGRTVLGTREVHAIDPRLTFANADEVSRRCEEALAGLKVAPAMAARAAQELLGTSNQEKP
jgi:hypothetical protein